MTDTKAGGITGKGFTKGDPRINRKGRPKSFDKLRELAISIASEEATDKDSRPLEWRGKPVTWAEFVLRGWMTDKKYQKDFIELAFGKVPQPVALTGADGGAVAVSIIEIIKTYEKRPDDESTE